jgi:hypothetical protein
MMANVRSLKTSTTVVNTGAGTMSREPLKSDYFEDVDEHADDDLRLGSAILFTLGAFGAFWLVVGIVIGILVS